LREYFGFGTKSNMVKPKSDAAILAKIDEDINDKLITEIEELKKQLEPFLKRDQEALPR